MSRDGADLIARTRSRLYAGGNDQRNKLAAGYTAGSGTLSFTYALQGLQAGARVSIGANTFYVWDVAADSKSATVSGGEEGSTDVNAAAGALVLVRPVVTDFEVLRALNDDLVDLHGRGLFAVKETEITFDAQLTSFDLGVADATVARLLQVQYRAAGSHKEWHTLRKEQWRFERVANTSDYPSGNALALQGASPVVTGQPIRVTYAVPFGQLTSAATTTASIDLPDTLLDLPPLGAAISLMAGKEVRRNNIEGQPEPRRPAEVGAGAVAGSVRGLMMLRAQRIESELDRLLGLYPDRVF